MTVLSALRERLLPAGWSFEDCAEPVTDPAPPYHYRFTSRTGQQVVEVEIIPGQTTLEGWIGRDSIQLTFGPGRPTDLVLKHLEDWRVIPSSAAATT